MTSEARCGNKDCLFPNVPVGHHCCPDCRCPMHPDCGIEVDPKPGLSRYWNVLCPNCNGKGDDDSDVEVLEAVGEAINSARKKARTDPRWETWTPPGGDDLFEENELEGNLWCLGQKSTAEHQPIRSIRTYLIGILPYFHRSVVCLSSTTSTSS